MIRNSGFLAEPRGRNHDRAISTANPTVATRAARISSADDARCRNTPTYQSLVKVVAAR